MKRLPLFLALLALAHPAEAQRRYRFGPTASTISIEDASGRASSYSSFGASAALLTGDDAEMGVTISRYDDLSSNACVRRLTFYGLDTYYYPVGADAIAPFASTQLGVAQVTESEAPLSATCAGPLPPTVESSTEIGFGFGLGMRLNVGGNVAGLIEGRFFQVPNSAIQALEARANVSVAFGRPREGEFLAGTVGPGLGFWIPVSGPLQGRGPVFGVRFRRDTRKAGSVGLQIDYAPLEIIGGCTAACTPYAILFAPGYEASLHPRWGRFYGELGVLIAGFPAQGPDRGMSQGAHGGLGADIYAGEKTMVNLNARLVWLQRNSGENVFGVQVSGSFSPKLVHRKATESP